LRKNEGGVWDVEDQYKKKGCRVVHSNGPDKPTRNVWGKKRGKKKYEIGKKMGWGGVDFSRPRGGAKGGKGVWNNEEKSELASQQKQAPNPALWREPEEKIEMDNVMYDQGAKRKNKATKKSWFHYKRKGTSGLHKGEKQEKKRTNHQKRKKPKIIT